MIQKSVLCPCKIHAISIEASVKRFEVEVILWINFTGHKAKQNSAWFWCTWGYSQVDKYHWIFCAWFGNGIPSYYTWNMQISFKHKWLNNLQEKKNHQSLLLFILYDLYPFFFFNGHDFALSPFSSLVCNFK